MHEVRITPAEPPHPPGVAEELARWMPPGAAVEPLRLFRTLVRNPGLAAAMHPLGSLLLSRRSLLTKREREIVIDRTTARCGCEYEWGVHVAAFGPAAGLDDGQLRATAAGSAGDPAWSGDDLLLVRLVDALHDGATVPDGLWQQLAARWSDERLLELVVLVGWYHLISFVANAAGVECEEWAPRFPVSR